MSQDDEILALKAQVAALTERLVAKDLPGAFTVSFKRMKAMAAILDRVPHKFALDKVDWLGGRPCAPDCPACAWQKLKASE